MSFRKFFFIVFVVFCTSATAQNKIGDAYKDGKGIFFKISGNGLKEPSYVLGTMHTIPGDFIWRLPQIDKIIGNVKTIACERKPRELSNSIYTNIQSDKTTLDAALIKIIIEKYATSNGMHESFISDLSIEQQSKCKEALKVIGFSNPKEWHAAVILQKMQKRQHEIMTQLFESENLHSVDILLDAYISDSIASQYNLPVYELDEANLLGIEDKAISNLKSLLNNETSRKQLSETIYNTILIQASVLSSTAQNFKQYLAQNHMALITEENQSSLNNTFIYKERNDLWMKKIPQLIKHKPTFIAVGLGHLFNRYDSIGILRQLENLGYKIDRLY